MEEYKRIRVDLIDFLRTACGQDYDAVYYYIGKYDFNQNDLLSLEVVADMVLTKATAKKKKPYWNSETSSLVSILYNEYEGTHLVVERHIRERLDAEQKAATGGMTYIPDSPRFVQLVSAAASELTDEDFAKIERHSIKSQTFTGQFTENLKQQLNNPIDNIGVGSLILYGIVIILVVLAIIY